MIVFCKSLIASQRTLPLCAFIEIATRSRGEINFKPLRIKRPILRNCDKHRKRSPPEWADNRNFACGEDTHALRLTSKLVDLQAGYANPIPRQSLGAGRFRAGIKKTSAQKDRGLFGTRNRNRTCN